MEAQNMLVNCDLDFDHPAKEVGEISFFPTIYI